MAQDKNGSNASERESYGSLMIASLRYRDFRLVWLGSVTEHLGEFMELAVILWLVNEMTRSPLLLTIVGSCRFMTMIIFPVAGGVVADRVNRRSLLIVTLLSGAFLSICLAILSVTDLLAIWQIIVISLLGGIVTSFNHPARHSIVPNLVRKEHLLNAIALDGISVQASRLLSMPLAGYVLAIVGAWPVFLLRALGCFLAIFWLLLAKVPPTPLASQPHAAWRSLTDGFRYLRAHTVILSLVALYLLPWAVANTVTTFLPIFAKDVLAVGAIGYGFLQGAPGLGAIISLLMLTVLTYFRRRALLLIGAGVAMGVGLLGFSASSWLWVSLLLLVFVGAMSTAFTTIDSTMIQAAVPDEVRGRVLSWREVAFGLGPTGSILFGAIAQYTGPMISMASLGAICIVLSIVLIAFLPRFRSVE